MRKIFAVAAIFISSYAIAQDTARTMEEVTLTASKYSTKTTETGKVVTIITRQDIERAGSRDLTQLLTEFGGTFINGYTSNPGKEKNVYLRGARPEHTLITIDGVPVYDASGIGSYFDLRNIAIDNVERIEILKGSQGTLYGSDAIAGVINIITRKGGNASGAPAVSHVMNYGSYHTFRSGTNVNGTFKKIDYNVGFSHLSSEGFSEAVKPATTAGSFDKDAYRQNSLNANFNIHAAGRISLQPFFRYTKFKGDIDLDAFNDEKDYSNTNGNLQAGIRNTFGVGKGQLNVLYQYINTKRDYLNDSLEYEVSDFYIYNNQQYKASEHFAEAFLVYPFGALKLTAGGDMRASNTSYSTVQVTGFPSAPPVYDGVKQNQLGLYAALNYALGNFNVEGGGRFNNHSEYGSNFAFNINPSHLIRNRVKVFANVSTGYKTPSLYQLFSLYGNEALNPETSLNLEGGVQVFGANQQNNLRVTYFNRHVKDLIAFVPLASPPYSIYENQDEQQDQGFEAEGNLLLAKKLQLKAIYNYVTGEITTQQAGKDTTYFNLLRRPKSTFSFFAGIQATKALYLNAQLNIIGERKDVYFDAAFNRIDITLKPYALLNFYAEYALSNRLKVFADVRNVLDTNYMDIYGYSTAGVNAYGGIRVKF